MPITEQMKANAATFGTSAIPPRYLTSMSQSLYINRALRGEDVYAYQQNDEWWIHDIDVEIPVNPFTTCEWTSRTCINNEEQWTIFADHEKFAPIIITIHVARKDGEMSLAYEKRARRIIDMIFGTIKKNNEIPSDYDGKSY